jgi:hypothetical protein
MSTSRAFTYTNPDLLALLEDLRQREPIFHRPNFPTHTSINYWEVGASGRRYSRDFILHHLEQNPPLDATTAGWHTTDHALQQLGPDTYLLTYTLQQGDRLTRRSTIWQSTPIGWQVLYHQGTPVLSSNDDEAPS